MNHRDVVEAAWRGVADWIEKRLRVDREEFAQWWNMKGSLPDDILRALHDRGLAVVPMDGGAFPTQIEVRRKSFMTAEIRVEIEYRNATWTTWAVDARMLHGNEFFRRDLPVMLARQLLRPIEEALAEKLAPDLAAIDFEAALREEKIDG